MKINELEALRKRNLFQIELKSSKRLVREKCDFLIFRVRQRTVCVIFWYSKGVVAKWINVRIFCIISWPHYNSGHPFNHSVTSVFCVNYQKKNCVQKLSEDNLSEDYSRIIFETAKWDLHIIIKVLNIRI